MNSGKRIVQIVLIVGLILALGAPVGAQEIAGSITGTVKDSTGAVVPDALVKAENTGTNLTVTAHSDGNGSYLLPNLQAGTYRVTITKDGFDTETHTQVLVNGDRTTTVDGSLKVGQVSATVEVTGTPLMNQVDTTNGYVVDKLTIEETPLGTGSFTQLAIMAPGVHADFLGGAGANTGLGNQAIFSNGQRDTSNNFSLDGIDTNNLFNGKTTSQVGENRFVLNTGENFGAGGAIQCVSVYCSIGQALPTPPPEAIQEVGVNAAMYDATQGGYSGAHVSVVTKSGTNDWHGMLYEKNENSALAAAPFFYNASPAIAQKVPYSNRNTYGINLGGPIVKNKAFFFFSYQGVRLADASNSAEDATVPLGLTNDRSTNGIVNGINASYPASSAITASQLSPAAVALLQAQFANGQYLIPSPQITNATQAKTLGYDVFVQGPNSIMKVNQGIGNIDYAFSDNDRLGVKYYVQTDPTSTPFSAVSALLGFPQQLQSGSQVASIDNTSILGPSLTWTQRVGFVRMGAYATTSQDFNPSQFGMNLLGSNTFPQLKISTADPTIAKGLEFGPSTSFGNAGMYQNQWQLGTGLNWVKGRQTLSFGGQWDHAQLNVINNNTNTDEMTFTTFLNFVKGAVKTGTSSAAFVGAASRYYRADTPGLFINDNYKLQSNLTLTMGLRWEDQGPLTEKYGKLSAFDPSQYSYNTATDTIVSSGLEVASGPNDSLTTGRRWGLAPRVGLAWSPMPKWTARAGFGIYFDRGELFTEFSPSAGAGFNGPFGVTLAPPFVSPIFAATGSTLNTPFGTTLPAPPPGTAAAFSALLPNEAQTISGKYPAGNSYGPFLFGGYDPANGLPYTENWSLDLQYQAANNWLFTFGYTGNHGQHEVLPIPFNQPLIATASSPVNGQTASYGLNEVPADTVSTAEFSGNAPVRVPYIGYDMNSVFYEAEGISNYNALQLQVHKRLSNGLQFTGAYTWSHSLDEQSGLGLFFTGNNASSPKSNYASSDFDQTHVLLINYSYSIPKLTSNNALGNVVNGWMIGGQTVFQSGEPYSVYDYTGSVGSLYYGTDDEITNPIVPLLPGVTAKQAQLQGTTHVNPANPVLNPNAFSPQFVTPGTYGVPAGDIYESLFGDSGRNLFRAPFQTRFDVTLGKTFQLHEGYNLRFNADAFNIFNHPNFDAPNNDVTFFSGYEPPPVFPPQGSLGQIQHTIGSPRFIQLSLHLTF